MFILKVSISYASQMHPMGAYWDTSSMPFLGSVSVSGLSISDTLAQVTQLGVITPQPVSQQQ